MSSIYSKNETPSGFYVYVWLSKSNIPFYIGKGHGNRAWQKTKGHNPPKDHTKIYIMEANLSELGAFALERRYIKWYGRKDIGTGILINKTNGGDGVSGYKRSEKWKIQKSLNSKLFRKNKNTIYDTLEYRKKLSESQKVVQSKPGARNNLITAISKNWIIIDPSGNKSIIKNLNQFCRDKNLSISCMSRVARGERKQHKNYLVRPQQP